MSKSVGKWDLKLGAEVTDQVRAAVVAGLSAAALDILHEGNRHVPTEHGELERSGTVELDANRLQARIGYGRGAPHGYAIRQHEDLTLKHDPGRTGKWLERALHAGARQAAQTVAQHVRRALS